MKNNIRQSNKKKTTYIYIYYTNFYIMASNINNNDNDVEMTYSDEYTIVSSTGTAGYNILNKNYKDLRSK